jgi:hypothetical protein
MRALALAGSMAIIGAVAAGGGGAAQAQEEPVGQPGLHIVTGQSPVVGGNAAAARERALDEALRQAVSQSLADMLDAPTRAAQAKGVKALEARARSYVRGYRTLEEGEAAGTYSVRLEAEVDEVALRRAAERLGNTAAPGQARPTSVRYVLVVSGANDFGPLLAAALEAAGAHAHLVPPAPPGQEPQVQWPAVPDSEAVQLATVRVDVTDEGPVRGTARVASSCRAEVRVTTARMQPVAEHTVTPRAFADRPDAARADCLARAAVDLASRMVRTGVTPAGQGDLRTIIVEADVVEPGAVAPLVKAIRSVGAVSSAELRRVSPGRAEIRVRTRTLAPALAPTLSRDGGGVITLSQVEVAGDRIRVKVRLRPAAPPPPAPSPPP